MPNPADNNKISAAAIGESLRRAREKKSVTVDQAQKQTHIHSTVITALEEGRCDDILTPNYVKSFLKEYSSYLGFDHQAVVSEYLSIHPELKKKNINLGGIAVACAITTAVAAAASVPFSLTSI